MTRYKDLVAYGPMIVSLILGAIRINLVAASLNANLASELLGFSGIRRTRLHLRSHKDLPLIPTFHRHATVLTSVNVDWSTIGRERLFSDFTISDESIAVPVVVLAATERASLLLRQGANANKSD